MTLRDAIVSLAISLVLSCSPAAALAQKLVYVVRHAERADRGMSQMLSQTDPPLSEAGIARAEKLAALLVDAGIQGIYVTEYRRTQDTAKPLASKLGLAPEQVSSKDTEGLLRKLRSEHANDIVLIVGHSDTVPAIIKALGGPAVTVADNEYDNLFILVPENGTLTRIRFAP